MKNTPSKRGSLLTAAWYRRSSSRCRGEPDHPAPRQVAATPLGEVVSFSFTSSTMPARADHNWRESDSDGWTAEAGVPGGIIGNLMREQ